MSTSFTLAANTRVDVFKDNVSVGDAVTYEIDCTPWQEENNTITTSTWIVEKGQAAISNQTLTAGIATALVSFQQEGRVLISILLSTATGQAKKMWLEVYAKDQTLMAYDYGMSE